MRGATFDHVGFYPPLLSGDLRDGYYGLAMFRVYYIVNNYHIFDGNS